MAEFAARDVNESLKNRRQRVEQPSAVASLERGLAGGFSTYLTAPMTPIRTRVPPLPTGPREIPHPERRHLSEPHAVEKESGELQA